MAYETNGHYRQLQQVAREKREAVEARRREERTLRCVRSMCCPTCAVVDCVVHRPTAGCLWAHIADLVVCRPSYQQQPNSHGFNSDLKARIRVQEMEVNRWVTHIEFLEEQERNLSEDLALL